MKKCSSCGKIYEGDVSFCSVCGAQVVEEVAEPVNNDVAEPVNNDGVSEEKPKKLLSVLIPFASDILTILTVFFSAVAVALHQVSVSVNISSYTYKIYASASVSPEAACSIFALLFALPTLALAVLSFIQSLVKREDLENKFAAIKKLAIGTFLVIFTIILVANI